MTETTSRFSMAIAVALIAGTAVLSGCGSAPYSRTSTSEETTTTIPAPPVSTTTTTTTSDQRSTQRP
jgi:hypothetical protein